MKSKRSFFTIFIIAGLLLGFMSFSSQTLAQEKPIEIIFSFHWTPAYTYIYDPSVHYMQRVEKDSNGRVKFKFYHSEQLYTGAQSFAACERGDIDMTYAIDLYNAGTIPEFGISNLPFLWASNESLRKTLDAGLWDLGIKQKLLEKHKLVFLAVTGGGFYQFWSKTPTYSPDQFKGKIWRVSGATASKACTVLGGTPTTLASGELYMALQKGVIDSAFAVNVTGIARKIYEIVKHISIVNFSTDTQFYAVNKKKWDSLPKDIQDIMVKHSKEFERESLQMLLDYETTTIQTLKDKGVNVHFSTPEELAKFQQASQPVYDWWLSQVPDGKKYIDFVKANH
jgi:TRAP-type transport system periplasmic protein